MPPEAFEMKAPGFASKVIRYFSLDVRGDEMRLLEQRRLTEVEDGRT